jgi:hypothetical protein
MQTLNVQHVEFEALNGPNQSFDVQSVLNTQRQNFVLLVRWVSIPGTEQTANAADS